MFTPVTITMLVGIFVVAILAAIAAKSTGAVVKIISFLGVVLLAGIAGTGMAIVFYLAMPYLIPGIPPEWINNILIALVLTVILIVLIFVFKRSWFNSVLWFLEVFFRTVLAFWVAAQILGTLAGGQIQRPATTTEMAMIHSLAFVGYIAVTVRALAIAPSWIQKPAVDLIAGVVLIIVVFIMESFTTPAYLTTLTYWLIAGIFYCVASFVMYSLGVRR